MRVHEIIEDRLYNADTAGHSQSKRVRERPTVIEVLREQVRIYIKTVAYDQGIACADVLCPSPDGWRTAKPPLPEITRLSLHSTRKVVGDLWARVQGEFEYVRDTLTAQPVIPTQPTSTQAAG